MMMLQYHYDNFIYHNWLPIQEQPILDMIWNENVLNYVKMQKVILFPWSWEN